MIDRRRFVTRALAGCSAAAAPAALFAQAVPWPDRPVKLISPYGAGGSNDIACRILAEELGTRLGQKFIVENKAGAGTRIGNDFVARAAPDGTTFLYAAAPYSTVESLYGKLTYDPRKDLKAVALTVVAPIFLIVNAASPWKTAQDLIAYGKKNPQGLTFASPGAGSGPHLAGELLFKEAGVKGLTVQFRGDATAYTELLAGRVDATLTAIAAALPHVQAGKLRVLGVASEERSPIYPTAPTLVEQGLPKVVGYGWFGLMAPSGTAPAVIERLSRETHSILAEAGVRQRLAALGLQARGSTPAEFQQFIDDEIAKWADVIRAVGIKGE